MENNKNKKSVKFQGDMLNFCDFIQVYVFTRNHHLKDERYKDKNVRVFIFFFIFPDVQKLFSSYSCGRCSCTCFSGFGLCTFTETIPEIMQRKLN